MKLIVVRKLQIVALKALRKIYGEIYLKNTDFKPDCIKDSDLASKIIYDALISDKPIMIGRFGSTELLCLANFHGVGNQKNQYLNYIRGISNPWWWEKNILIQMQQWSGFFPPTIYNIEKLCELMLDDMSELDILGSWLDQESIFEKHLNCKKVHLRLLEPFWSKVPWTKALKNKRVLVVHPFSETIEQQYLKRKYLFKKEVLPDFELKTFKAVQTIAGNTSDFHSWFDALDYMKSEIDRIDFDICLIGCGAYGFHLAAHVKRSGRKAIHLGGSLQLLFGIKGKRWEDPNYGVEKWGIPYGSYTDLFNEFWVRPDLREIPIGANKVENSCYW